MGLVLAHGATTEEVDDPEQHDRAKERDCHRRDVDRTAGDRRTADERCDQEARKKRADDADHDVEQDALLSVGAHDDACQPADDAADDEKNDKAHNTLHFRFVFGADPTHPAHNGSRIRAKARLPPPPQSR